MFWFVNILKGTVMGMANVIPGVSGGTMAFVLGIYDHLLEAIGEFFVNKEKRWDYIRFLLTLGLGLAIGLLGFSWIIEYFLNNHREPTHFLFFGLIIGSIPFIIKMHDDMKFSFDRVLFYFLGLMIVAPFVFLNPFEGGVHVPEMEVFFKFVLDDSRGLKIILVTMPPLYALKLMGLGFIASGTMVLPGVSGSLLMLLLGEYQNILYYVNQRILTPVMMFALGVGCGILIVAKLLDMLLKKYPSQMLYLILGLVTGSLIKIYPGFSFSGWLPLQNILALIFGIIFAQFVSRLKDSMATSS